MRSRNSSQKGQTELAAMRVTTQNEIRTTGRIRFKPLRPMRKQNRETRMISRQPVEPFRPVGRCEKGVRNSGQAQAFRVRRAGKVRFRKTHRKGIGGGISSGVQAIRSVRWFPFQPNGIINQKTGTSSFPVGFQTGEIPGTQQKFMIAGNAKNRRDSGRTAKEFHHSRFVGMNRINQISGNDDQIRRLGTNFCQNSFLLFSELSSMQVRDVNQRETIQRGWNPGAFNGKPGHLNCHVSPPDSEDRKDQKKKIARKKDFKLNFLFISLFGFGNRPILCPFPHP